MNNFDVNHDLREQCMKMKNPKYHGDNMLIFVCRGVKVGDMYSHMSAVWKNCMEHTIFIEIDYDGNDKGFVNSCYCLSKEGCHCADGLAGTEFAYDICDLVNLINENFDCCFKAIGFVKHEDVDIPGAKMNVYHFRK